MKRPFLTRQNEIAQIARRRAWLIKGRSKYKTGVRYWRFTQAYPGGLETTAYWRKAMKGPPRDEFEEPVSMFACYRGTSHSSQAASEDRGTPIVILTPPRP